MSFMVISLMVEVQVYAEGAAGDDFERGAEDRVGVDCAELTWSKAGHLK